MPFTFKKSDLPILDLEVSRGTAFQAWEDAWDCYADLSGLSGQDVDAATKVKALKLCLTMESREILNSLGLTDEQMASHTQIISAMKTHVQGQINETIERRNLSKRRQQPGESVDDYLLVLRTLVKTCNFCTDACREKALRDQLIEGLRNEDIVEELLKINPLTLTVAIDTAKGSESAKKNRKDVTGPAGIQAVKSDYKKGKKKAQDRTAAGTTCQNCGRTHQRDRCPAKGKQCTKCKKMDHFERVCRSEKKTTGKNTVGRLSAVNSTLDTAAPTIVTKVTCQRQTVDCEMLPDSGADISAGGPNFLKLIGEDPFNLVDSDVKPEAVNGLTHESDGQRRRQGSVRR